MCKTFIIPGGGREGVRGKSRPTAASGRTDGPLTKCVTETLWGKKKRKRTLVAPSKRGAEGGGKQWSWQLGPRRRLSGGGAESDGKEKGGASLK